MLVFNFLAAPTAPRNSQWSQACAHPAQKMTPAHATAVIQVGACCGLGHRLIRNAQTFLFAVFDAREPAYMHWADHSNLAIFGNFTHSLTNGAPPPDVRVTKYGNGAPQSNVTNRIVQGAFARYVQGRPAGNPSFVTMVEGYADFLSVPFIQCFAHIIFSSVSAAGTRFTHQYTRDSMARTEYARMCAWATTKRTIGCGKAARLST